MCGIAGILDRRRQPQAGELASAVASLRPRGPDHQNAIALDHVALGHTRLAIIDLVPESNQPMADTSGRAWIVYNGELYNYRELRRDLESRGARFRTNSDTEVLLEAYKAWGAACVERFNGMFAFAIWDADARALFLARDRLGEKPLYYASLADGRFVFASDLNALRCIDGVPRAIDPDAIIQFLTLGYLLNDCCIVRGVSKLPPGHRLTLREGSAPLPERYWDLAAAFRKKSRFRSEDEACEALNALVDDAVRARMVGDVPLGVFLSGGMDSSVVCGAMTRAGGGNGLRSFTIDFAQRGFSEARAARAASNFFGTNHCSELIDLDDAAAELPMVVAATGEPFADTSIIPTYCLARMARRNAKFCLSGDGGDELFAGYETYRADRIRRLTSWLPSWSTSAMLSAIDRFLPDSYGKVGFDYKLRQFLRGRALPADQAHFFWRVIFDAPHRNRVLLADRQVCARQDPAWDGFAAHAAEAAGCHYLDRAMYVDIKTWLADDILVKVDRASMAHSLELRPPLLDHRLVEFAAALPVSMKLRGFERKYLLKKAQRAKLPPSATGRGKRGFNAPVSHWFKSRLADMGRDATLAGPLADWTDRGAVEGLWVEHRAGRRDHGFRLFVLTCLGLWLAGAGRSNA